MIGTTRWTTVGLALAWLAACGTSGATDDSGFRFAIPDDVCGLELCPNDDRIGDRQIAACHELMSVPDDACRDDFRRLAGCSVAATVCDASGRLDQDKSQARIARACRSSLASYHSCCGEHGDSAVCAQ